MDARPEIDVAARMFGIPVTITRPHESAFGATGIWINESQAIDELPVGRDFSRGQRMMAFRLDEVSTLPRGAVISAAEQQGGAVRNWQVDSTESTKSDHIRVILIPETATTLWPD